MSKPRREKPDYYKALQVDPSADPEIIKVAFAKLALKYHPDQNKSPDANERMVQIIEARDCLCDPVKRAEYDRNRQEEERERSHREDPADPPNPIVRPSRLDFGELQEREVVSKRLTVDNAGGRASERNIDLANGTGPFRIIDAYRISDDAAFPLVVTIEASANGLTPGKVYSDYLQIDLDGIIAQAVLELRVRKIVSEPSAPRDVPPSSVPSTSPSSSASSPRPVHRGWIVFSAVILFVIIALLISNLRSGPTPDALMAPNGAETLVDELANTSVGNPYGISWTNGIGGHGAVFRAANASRIEYPGRIPSEGTIEFWIKVDSGFQYQNYAFRGNLDTAMIFSTDPEGGDVTWPGTTKFFVSRNGNVSLSVANHKYDQPPTPSLDAQGTPFRFGEWHAIGFSVGASGQFIMADGQVVAADQTLTQAMGCAGTHVSPADIPTVGETVSHYWPHHQYEGGFEGIVARFRASPKQQDWNLARGIATSKLEGRIIGSLAPATKIPDWLRAAVAQRSITAENYPPPEDFQIWDRCAGEGCGYQRPWLALKEVPLFAAWGQPNAERVYTLADREVVKALAGVVIVRKPAVWEVEQPINVGGVDLQRGDLIYVLLNLGEGYSRGFFHGKLADFSPDVSNDRSVIRRLSDDYESVLWVQMQTGTGVVGWTNDGGYPSFDGQYKLFTYVIVRATEERDGLWDYELELQAEKPASVRIGSIVIPATSKGFAKVHTGFIFHPGETQAIELIASDDGQLLAKTFVEPGASVDNFATHPPQPVTSSQTQSDDQVATQLLQEAQTLFEQRQYSEALTRCNTLLERDPKDLQALELRQRIQKAIDILKP